MKQAIYLSTLAILLPIAEAWPAGGSIPFKPGVKISKPNQWALIAYDGATEILMIVTELKASEPTKVLEVIPFPSEPKATKGDAELIVKANRHVSETLNSRGRRRAGPAAAPTVGEVTFEKKIGAKNITIVHAIDSKKFSDWVEMFLEGQGVDKPAIPKVLKADVEEYLRSGCQWFAFNVIELGPNTVTKDAIRYEFNSKFLYYPLRITRADHGTTSIRLLLISPRLVHLPSVGTPRVRLLHRPVEIPRKTVEYWNAGMSSLFDKDATLLLRAWGIKGRASAFTRDIATTWFE